MLIMIDYRLNKLIFFSVNWRCKTSFVVIHEVQNSYSCDNQKTLHLVYIYIYSNWIKFEF
jgi:hypothetical protein